MPAQGRLNKLFTPASARPVGGGGGKLRRETRPDRVSLATPNKSPHALTLLALSRGAHVACEKPMAMTVAEAAAMETARAAAGKLGSINFSYRNVPAFRFARELIEIEMGGATISAVDAPYRLTRFQGQDKLQRRRWCQVHLGDLGTAEQVVGRVVVQRKCLEVLFDHLGFVGLGPNRDVNLGPAGCGGAARG